jgi:hypothetical protein
MSGYALRGAFENVCAFPHAIHNWWQEKTFWLYYYSFSQDPRHLLGTLPVSPALIDKMCLGIDTARNNLINNTATRIAAGEQAKPTFGNAWTGLMAHMQSGLRPALDIAMRTGLSGPMKLAVLGLTAVMIADAYYGGPITQALATFNSESGRSSEIKTALAPKKTRQKKMPKKDYRPEVFRLYAQPSFS